MVTDCRVSGAVRFGQENQFDDGAVVLLLPRSARPENRFDASLLHPDDFKPLDNPAIDFIHNAGGAVVRTDDRGEFEVFVSSPGDYYVMVISGNQQPDKSQEMTKAQMAGLGSYFISVDRLMENRAYQWDRIQVNSASYDLPVVKF